jgi:hypothetical protein
MISDVASGDVVPGSVRVLKGEESFADVELPTDGPYAAF